MKNQKIAVVGGAGYIGSALAEHLRNTFKVKVLDKNLPKKLMDKVEYQNCDIIEYEEVKRGLKDVDLVIHTAIIQIPLINEEKELGYKVNLLGIQNVCRVVNETPSIKGLILTGSWHVFGEQDLKGVIDEKFGYRPDKVEDRARLYALSKIAQEVVVRLYDEFSKKIYGVVRLGTVLGEGMPEKTAANIFISKGLKGEALTPYKHSMYRPMLYVDINDVCKAFYAYSMKILNGALQDSKNNSFTHTINLVWPTPMTIVELANVIKNAITKLTYGKIRPSIEIVDKGLPLLHSVQSRKGIEINIDKVQYFLNMKLTNPKKTIEKIIKNRIST